MHIRSVRCRRATGNALAIGASLLAVSGGLCAAQGRSETTLMGVTLLKSNYRDVLKKFGKPDEIQAGGPFVPNEGVPGGKAAAKSGPGAPGSGGMMPGGPGAPSSGGMMPGGSSGTGAAKRATSKNGFPSKSGGAAGPSGSTYPGAPPSGGSAGPGLPGFAGSIGAMLGPGAAGSGGMMPGAPGSGGMMPGGPGASGAPADTEEPPEYQATWWYHDTKHGLHRSFLFNKDGRVIQVQEYGYDKFHLGGKTQRGVALGSNMGTVLKQYGWSNNGANNGKLVVLRYGGEEKVAFQLVNNNVVGITIAVVKDNPTEGPK